jgi:hypothetical protein
MERIETMFHCDCHYTCDVCQRVLDATSDQRYVLRITASGAGEDADRALDDDPDYLEQIDDRLICARDFEDDLVGQECDEEVEYDLCPECRQKFSLESLGRRAAPSLDFSNN